MEYQKIFLNESGKATFACPQCRKTSKQDFTKFLHIDKPLKLKCVCKCGNNYGVELERRKYVRKKTELLGKYFGKRGSTKGLMTVIDVSQSGLKMSLNVEPCFSRGEELLVEFKLDNVQRDIVTRDVVVKSIKGRDVGVEFMDDIHYDKLGKYIAFN